MAITGTFVADFKSFYDAVQQSTVKLKDFQSNAETVARSVDKVANAFSGRKLVQDAEIMTKAITEIGGATALTAKEQAQVNAKLAEAIEKYKALGQVAPKEMQDLEKATRGVNQETAKTTGGLKDIGGGLLSIASAVGIAFSVDALVGFVGHVFDAAEKVTDLSEKLGISTGAVQRFTYAAEQSGATIDDVGAAIFKMNQKLAEGSKTTVHALKDLGLTLADVRQMSPEQAFIAITDALEKIENPAMRARLEIELLGKAGGALGAAISAGLSKTGDAAKIMADDTIRRLAEAKQAWENLAQRVTVITGEMIANVLKFRGSHQIVEARALGEGAPVPGGRGGKDVTLPAGGGIQAGAAELERLAKEREAAARKMQAAADQQKAADEKIFAGMRQFSAELAKRDTNMARSLQGIQAFVEKNRQLKDVISATIPAEASRQWTDWRGRIDANARSLEQWGRTAGAAMTKSNAEARRFFNDLEKANQKAKAELLGLVGALGQVGGMIGGPVGNAMQQAANGFLQGAAAADQFEQATTKAGKAMALLNGVMAVWNATASQTSAVGTITSGMTSGAAAGSMFGPAGAGVGAYIGGFIAVLRHKNEYSVIQKKLIELGLLENKTVDDLDAATEDLTRVTEAQAVATIETASEAKRAMEELEPLLKANEDQWRAWGDVVNSQIDRVAAALRSLALPTLSGAALTQPAPNATGGGTAVINIDGRQIAEAVVPRIPGVVRRYGLA